MKDNRSMIELYNRAKKFEPMYVDEMYEMYLMGSLSADEFRFTLLEVIRDWNEYERKVYIL